MSSNRPGKRKRYYSVRSFASYMRRYWRRFALVLGVFIIGNALIAIVPLFIGRLVGALAAHPVQGHQAVVYVWILIICSTGHNLIWRLGELLYRKHIIPLGFLYENILFQRVVRKPYPYFVDKFTGKISSYINVISQESRDFISNLLYDYTGQIVNLVIVGLILFSVNWQTGVIFVGGLLGMAIVGRYTVRNSSRYEGISADVQSTKNGKIIDAIANFVNIKSFQKEPDEIAAIAREQDKSIAASRQSFLWGIIFWGSMSFFIRDLMWPATLGLNVYLFLHHELSIAQLTTVLSTILLFSTAIWEAVWHISQINLKLARVEEAHQYLFGNVNVVSQHYAAAERPAQQHRLEHGLALRELTFAYPDKTDATVLDNISLELKKGEKLGIVGKSGSGKTTLTKLLLGYYPVAAGTIRLDGIDVDTKALARLISYVPQDTSLFHRSVAENIAYASDRAVSREEIVAAAKQAHADEFISQIHGGYEALVGERGVKLSSGQRQRIAIARAVLDDKPLLILDEATSALDSESEVLVQEALEALWQHKTVIAIAHRLSTLRHMDRIVVMHGGKIVEQGTHRELLESKGVYAKLWAHQSGGFIEN